jgi:hypothetical protein
MNNLIYQRISAIMSEINAISKNRNNQSQGYKFRGIDDVYNELHPLLAKYKVFSTTNVLSEQRIEKPSKSGGVLSTSIFKIEFTFFAEDGSNVKAVTIGEGMDSGDKSSNKAMAIAHKYALVQLFSIPTEDDKDPENDSPEPKQYEAPKKFEAPKTFSEPKTVLGPSEAQLKRLHTIASVNGWSNDEVKNIMREKFNGLDSSKNLSRKQYDDLCEFLGKNKPYLGNLPM